MGATALMIGLTAATGAWKAKSEYDANKAQARQMQQQADMAYMNAKAKDEQAHEQAQDNALNQEVKRRQMAAKIKEQENQLSASGLMMNGSNASVLADSHYNMMFDLGIDSYNGRTKVDNLFQQSTDYTNQGDIYANQANQFKKAAKMSVIKNVLETGASIALAGAGGGAGKVAKAKNGIVSSSVDGKFHNAVQNLYKKVGGV